MALKLLSVAAGRSDLLKVAAICDAIQKINCRIAGEPKIQHVLVEVQEDADSESSERFNDVELPRPNLYLQIGPTSGSVGVAQIMESFEKVILREQPYVVLTLRDTDSTLACALTAKKTWYSDDRGARFTPKVAHIDAGLRTFDRTLPEEINGVVTDSISDYLFTTEESANRNLFNQGIPAAQVFFIGNLIVDMLLRYYAKARESTILHDLQLTDDTGVKPYALMTLDKFADQIQNISQMLETLLNLSKRMPIIFSAHPKTIKRLQDENLTDYFVDHFVQDPERWDARVRIRLIPQLGYLDFLRLMSMARVVLTDSGAIQDETTMLGVSCITLANNTNRLVTVEEGTNVLAGCNPTTITAEFNRACSEKQRKHYRSPHRWNGNAAERLIKILLDHFTEEFVEDRGSGSESRYGRRTLSLPRHGLHAKRSWRKPPAR